MGAAACGDDGGSNDDSLGPVTHVSSLVRFESCDELTGWATEEIVPRIGAYGVPTGPGITEEGFAPAEPGVIDGTTEELEESAGEFEDGAGAAPDVEVDMDVAAPGSAESGAAVPQDAQPDTGASDRAADDSAVADAEASAGADAPSDDGESGETTYSETNVQVSGVDEPDVVKTDGERVVALADGSLHLAEVESGELLDSLPIPSELRDVEMFLAGDRVLLFGTSDVPPERPDVGAAGSDITMVAEVDLSGDDLELGEVHSLDGWYVSARMIDDTVRLVLRADPVSQLPFVAPTTDSEEARERAAEANRQMVAEVGSEELLPEWHRIDDQGEVVESGTLLDCDQAHAPDTFAGFGTVAVVTFDVSDGLASGLGSSGGAGVMAEAETVYASPENLYVASPDWREPEGLEGPVGDDIPVFEEEEEPGTNIHQFDIGDPTAATYEMSGRVDGWLLNQFALDEHDGHLRVATTTGDPMASGADRSQGQVVVLAPEDGELTEVGSVAGLGRGETIHAVRFMGDTGYVVTFQQTDPLYVIDLSEPTEPEETGELEMLGYSAYLHPVGDGLLLGVGQDATEQGIEQGTMVSLFDVSDPTAPVKLDDATLEGGNSTAEADHRAFLWWEPTELAAIPVSSYGSDVGGSGEFHGLVGFTVDRDGHTLEELGRIEHEGDTTPVGVPEPGLPVDDVIAEPFPGGGVPIIRSLVIEDTVWTVSDAGFGLTDLENLDETEMIDF